MLQNWRGRPGAPPTRLFPYSPCIEGASPVRARVVDTRQSWYPPSLSFGNQSPSFASSHAHSPHSTHLHNPPSIPFPPPAHASSVGRVILIKEFLAALPFSFLCPSISLIRLQFDAAGTLKRASLSSPPSNERAGRDRARAGTERESAGAGENLFAPQRLLGK